MTIHQTVNMSGRDSKLTLRQQESSAVTLVFMARNTNPLHDQQVARELHHSLRSCFKVVSVSLKYCRGIFIEPKCCKGKMVCIFTMSFVVITIEIISS